MLGGFFSHRLLLQVAEAIAAAVEKGLNVPIIYNTSSYDALASLQLLDGLVDIVSATSRDTRHHKHSNGPKL